jgi:hypothetical protein
MEDGSCNKFEEKSSILAVGPIPTIAEKKEPLCKVCC